MNYAILQEIVNNKWESLRKLQEL